MTAFASTDEFAARIGVTLTDTETTRAGTLLQLASDLIASETQQTISLVTDDVLTRPSVYDERFRLPERPVISVSSVKLNDVEITQDGEWYLDGDEIVRANWRLLSQRHFFAMNGVGWLGPLFTLQVTYTHGWATIPAVVKTACLEMCVRVWVNPGSVARENIAGVSTVYDNMRFSPTGMFMTDAEREAVFDIVRRRSGTIGLR